MVSRSLHEKAPLSAADEAWNNEYHIMLKSNMLGYVERGLSAELSRLAESAYPPSNNMGGNLPDTPPNFPHGEKPGQKVSQKTSIDWLGFTSSADIEAVKCLIQVIWPDAVFSRHVKGMPGYPDAYLITVDSVQFGMLGTGAVHERHFVSLTGTACKTLNDELISVLYDAFTLEHYDQGQQRMVSTFDIRLSRVDICLDMYRGEVTWDHARRAFDNDRFKNSKGGRSPQLKVIDLSQGSVNLGRTMYVGKRDGEVMARIYEKGLEVFAKLPEELRLLSEERETLYGSADIQADNWLRLEVEYKRVDKNRPLSFDMIIERDRYFAGAYPYFADVIGRADGLRPVGMKTDFDVDLLALMSNAKRSYGALIHSLTDLGFTPSEVVQHLSSGRHNDKLVRSGLLAKLKQAVEQAKIDDPDIDIPF